MVGRGVHDIPWHPKQLFGVSPQQSHFPKVKIIDIERQIVFPTCKDSWMEPVEQPGIVADKVPSQLHPFVPFTLALGLHQKDC